MNERKNNNVDDADYNKENTRTHTQRKGFLVVNCMPVSAQTDAIENMCIFPVSLAQIGICMFFELDSRPFFN